MTKSEILLGLPDFQITDIGKKEGTLSISARYTGPRCCAYCGGARLRNKGWIHRRVRHEDWGLRHCVLEVQAPKSKCLSCGRQSRQPLPGILRCQLGRSEAALAAYLARLEGQAEVRVVCMDLASVYRSIVRQHFPNARIVADRFHVIRLVNHHFLACWKELDPVGSKNRGLLSLLRRHRHNLQPEQQTRLSAYLANQPALELIYRFKQRLCYLLLKKHRTRTQCDRLAPRFLRAVYQLRQAGLAQLSSLRLP